MGEILQTRHEGGFAPILSCQKEHWRYQLPLLLYKCPCLPAMVGVTKMDTRQTSTVHGVLQLDSPLRCLQVDIAGRQIPSSLAACLHPAG